MSGYICPTVTPDIERLYNEIVKLYPEASRREELTADKVAEWVGIYNTKNNKTLDFVPSAKELVNSIEKWRNMDNKSFKKDVSPIQMSVSSSASSRSALDEALTQQTIEQIKKSVPDYVEFRDAMDKYLKEHNTDYIQQAIEEQREMQDIKEKALADGTFMKAPNGRPTNLTERQWLQVRTKNFIKWFGDWENDPANASKVVDENGEPLVVYHGSNSGSFSVFNTNVGAIYTTDSKLVSQSYTIDTNSSRYKDVTVPLQDTIDKIEHGNDINLKDAYGWKGSEYKLLESLLEPLGLTPLDIKLEEKETYSLQELKSILHKLSSVKTFELFEKISNPIIIDAKGKNWNEIEYEGKVLSTRDLENIFKGSKTDGIIIKNVMDYGGLGQIGADEYEYAEEDLYTPKTVFIAYNSNQAKSATDNNGEFSTESDDIQMAIKSYGINNSLSLQEKNNIRTLLKRIDRVGTTLLDDGNGTMYLLDHTDREGIENRNPKKQDGFNCRLKFSTDGYTKEEIKEIKNLIENGNIRDQKSFNKWAKSNLDQQGSDNSDSIVAEVRASNAGDDRLYLQTPEGEPFGEGSNTSSSKDFGTSFIRVYNNDGTNNPRYIPIGIDNINQEYRTSAGEIYGFVAPNNHIYFDETIIKPEHAIHEFTHLWDRVMAKTHPEVWEKGIELMKDTTWWKEVEDNPNYGVYWKSKGIKGKQLDSLIASEVHSRIIGEEGEKLLKERAKAEGSDSIYAKLLKWIEEFWKDLKASFSDWSQEEIDKLTLENFNKMTVRDLAEGKNIVKYLENTSALKVNDSRAARFNRTFTPQQVKDRGAMIADKFSDILDEALEDEVDRQKDIIDSNTASEAEKDAAKTRIKELRDPINGRQLIAREIGIENIIKQIKSQLQKDLERGREGGMDEKQTIALENTIEYFKELFNTQATLDIEDREGIRIVGLEIKEDNPEEEENTEIDNGDDDTGHIASGSDGWSFQVRYEDPFNSLSRKVKGLLYDVRRPESEKDDFGYVRRYPTGQIYASLISFLSKNVESADDFLQVNRDLTGEETDAHGAEINNENYPNGYPTFPALEKMKVQYPWVEQIIQRLTDDYARPDLYNDLRYPSTGGSLASQFYTNFRKAYIPYAKIQLGEDNFGVTPLNYEMADRVQYDKLVANYNNRLVLTPMSIYDTNGRINKDNIPVLKEAIGKVLHNIKSLGNVNEKINDSKQAQYVNPVIDEARNVLQSFGIDATQEGVTSYLLTKDGSYDYSVLEGMLYDLEHILGRLKASVSSSNISTYNYISDTVDTNGNKMWTHFFDGRGFISDDTYMQSYYDSASKKTKYSYSADNYLMKTFRGVAFGTQAERRAYIDEHFGKFEWFKNQRTGEWRNKWLEFWYNFSHDVDRLPYRNIDNISEQREDKTTIVRSYSKWTKEDIWQVQNRNYDAEKDSDTSFYLSPIFSDSPMSMTVRGPRMNLQQLLYGYTDKANVRHQGALVQLVNQELWRIQQTQKRAEALKNNKDLKPIANFDDNKDKGFCGFRFCFFPELNDYTFENNEKFLDRMIRLKKEKATLQQIELAEIQAIKEILDRKLNDYVNENKKHYEGELDDTSLREQYYNMIYANAAITQLTTVDLAFYKDATDFQKRFKEVYAGGIQLNTNSKYGKKTENVVMVSDDIITSPSYDKIAAIIDKAPNLTEKEKESIKEKFTDINVADAQAIRSMHSFRSVLDMMGKWDENMEQALNRFEEGTWSREDFDVIYQIIKPFVYSVIERNDGLGNTMLVPQQNKNSEICALMMYDLITNGLDNSPVYKALSKFMEETTDSNGEYLIDMIQFESAGKVGNQGTVNISFNPNKVIDLIDNGITIGDIDYTFYPAEKDGKITVNNLEGAEENYKAIKKQLDKKLTSKEMSQNDHDKVINYLRPTEEEIVDMLTQKVLVANPDGTKNINTEMVHTIPFENYYQQQPTPEHHIDAQATFGSQTRNISVADLPEDFEITVEGKDKTQKTLHGGKSVVDFYYELLNENLLEDFFGKGSNKGLKGLFESKESLRDAVTEIVRGNSKYGRDFTDALQIVDGDFALSPNSPTMFTLMQEIMTSFFKNRITKQTIDGAALIQAAGIGLDEDLRLVFDANGKLLGAECYMPLTTRKFFEPLLKTQVKTINGEEKEIQVLDTSLLKELGLDKAIGYRIPTENKSSMMPLIIKDFTPLQNGSAIVLPAEVTTMAGSDFDVDKMFIMLSSFSVQEYKMKKAREDYAKENEQYKKLLSTFTNSELAENLMESEPENFKEWFDRNKDNYKLKKPVIRKVEYDFNKEPKDNSRKARNNMVIQIMYNILTSKAGSESLFNPQGFSDVKRAAKIARIITDDKLKKQLLLDNENTDNADTVSSAINYLMSKSTKELENFINTYSPVESPVYPQAFAHAHDKNMAGSLQIGIYAIQASMAAKYQRADIRLKDRQRFILNGRELNKVDASDGGKRLKYLGQMVGASADNGKDPNLSDMGSTMKTAPIIGYMLRLGLSPMEASLIINQPCMKEAGFSSSNLAAQLGGNPLMSTVSNKIGNDILIRNILDKASMSPEEDMSIKGICYRILKQYEAMEYVTQVSRADSPNGSIKNSYAKARVQKYKVDLMQAKMGQRNFPFLKIREAISNDAVDITKGKDTVREELKQQSMGLLHGFYALGINSYDKLIRPYFFGAEKEFDDKVIKPILYNLNEKMTDEKKAEVVNNIYTSYITFILSGSPLFSSDSNKSMKEKREYYLNQFPNDYIKTIQDNKDIRETIGNILQVQQKGSRKRLVLQDVGSLSKGQKADVQRRLENLIYSDNSAAKKLAEDLLIYSYYDNGLKFTSDSFSHLFTTGYLLNFPAYVDTLKTLDRKLTDEEYNNFILQFLLTYPSAAYKADGIVKEADNVSDNGNTIKIDLNDVNMRRGMVNDVMSPNPLLEGNNVYPYISYNEELYVLDQDKFNETPGRPEYHLVNKYSTFPKLPLFNIEMSPSQMAEEFPWTQEAEQEAEGPSIEELYDDYDIPAAPSLPDEDPAVSESLFNTVDEMPEFATPDPEVVNFAQQESKEDQYKNEGESEMQDPMCIK